MYQTTRRTLYQKASYRLRAWPRGRALARKTGVTLIEMRTLLAPIILAGLIPARSLQGGALPAPVRATAAAASLVALGAVAVLFVTGQPTRAQTAAQPPARAQNPARLDDFVARRDQARKHLESSRRYLEENRQRVGKIEAEMARLKEERARLNRALIETGSKIKARESKMTEIEGRLEELEVQERTLRQSLSARHKSISRLLAAIQRMGRNPPPVMITRRSDALAMVRSAMLLARAFPELSGQAHTLARELNTLVALMTSIRKENGRLRAEADTLKKDQARLATLMRTKRQSLGDRKVELAEVRRTVQVIGKNVVSLEDLINRLEPAIEAETKIGREIEAAERARAAAKAAAEKARKQKGFEVALNVPKPPVPDAQPKKPAEPAVIKPPSAIELTPKQGGNYVGDNARLAPAIPFHQAKGKLPLPAAGELITRFGERTELGARSKGLVIKTRFGAQITSPTDGWIVYAGKFRTYGQLLIIKAGNGYHVLLAGLSKIDVQAGQFVLAAEPVGTMKRSPGIRAGKNSPKLYVEFRKDGRPINPRPWWSASLQQRVQG